MGSLKTQYFLTYAVLGNLLPFIPVYLAGRGLTLPQIGEVLATAGFAVLVTPMLVGLLADTHIDPRRLMAALCALAGAAAATLYFVAGFWPILLIYTLHNLAFVPFISLEDGMNFSLQRDLLRRSRPIEPYHRVRVWGTIGFILPSVVLYFLLRAGLPLGVILFSATGFCALGFCNTFLLPEGCRPPQSILDLTSASSLGARAAEPRAVEPGSGISNLNEAAVVNLPGPIPARRDQIPNPKFFPAFTALRAMLEPHLLTYCVGMFLLNMSTFAYYAIYPIYLTRRAHIGPQWVGLIANVGVVGEVFYMMNFGRLERALGLKRLVATGVAGIILRLSLLGLSGAWLVAIGTQLIHGLQVLVVQVVPPVYLDRHAHDTNRNSMQGMYTMLINGTGRIAGSLAAGWIAGNLATVFFAAAALSGLAGGILTFAFRPNPAPAEVAVGD